MIKTDFERDLFIDSGRHISFSVIYAQSSCLSGANHQIEEEEEFRQLKEALKDVPVAPKTWIQSWQIYKRGKCDRFLEPPEQ